MAYISSQGYPSEAPPAYTEDDVKYTPLRQEKAHLNNSKGNSQSQTSNLWEKIPRTLHIYATCSSGHIVDQDKSSELFTYTKHSCRSPHIELRSSGGQQMGTVKLHGFKSKIDLVLHGQPIVLESNGVFHSGHHMRSQAPGSGGSLTFKTESSFTCDKVCFNAQNELLARYESSKWAKTKQGKLHLMGPAAIPGPLMDEVVLIALAELEYTNRANAAAAAAGA